MRAIYLLILTLLTACGSSPYEVKKVANFSSNSPYSNAIAIGKVSGVPSMKDASDKVISDVLFEHYGGEHHREPKTESVKERFTQGLNSNGLLAKSPSTAKYTLNVAYKEIYLTSTGNGGYNRSSALISLVNISNGETVYTDTVSDEGPVDRGVRYSEIGAAAGSAAGSTAAGATTAEVTAMSQTAAQQAKKNPHSVKIDLYQAFGTGVQRTVERFVLDLANKPT